MGVLAPPLALLGAPLAIAIALPACTSGVPAWTRTERAPTAIDRCPGSAPPPAPRPARPACTDPTRRFERVTIAHLSDVHAHWHPYLFGRSPFAVLRAYVERRRREEEGRFLFFDAGDDFEKGTVAEHRSGGYATAHLLDHLGLDARVIGNHDYAYSVENVLAQASTPFYDVLATNVAYLPPPLDGLPHFRARRTAVYDIGCARIGVLGLVVNGYGESDARIDEPYLDAFVQAHDRDDMDRYADVVAPVVSELRARDGVDAVIAINHLGHAIDKSLTDEVPGLDLVIGGHDHTYVEGPSIRRYGAAVDIGTFLGPPEFASIGEVVLVVDRLERRAVVEWTRVRRLADLPDWDLQVEGEVRRMMACFAPDADRPLAEVSSRVRLDDPQAWTPIVDAALRHRFPNAVAFVYDAWTSEGMIKADIPAGPITIQQLADLAFVERQRAGYPGFTAFQPIDLEGTVLRAVCAAPLRDRDATRLTHRVCPPSEWIEDSASYRAVIERRQLYAPEMSFAQVPRSFPTGRSGLPPAVEAYVVLAGYAAARGRACLALDRDVKSRCF